MKVVIEVLWWIGGGMAAGCELDGAAMVDRGLEREAEEGESEREDSVREMREIW